MGKKKNGHKMIVVNIEHKIDVNSTKSVFHRASSEAIVTGSSSIDEPQIDVNNGHKMIVKPAGRRTTSHRQIDPKTEYIHQTTIKENKRVAGSPSLSHRPSLAVLSPLSLTISSPPIDRNLKDLCLEGTLAPELGKLTYIKLMGNFSMEIGELKELEVLDLGYNFSGPFPSYFGNYMSLSILLLDNNNFNISPELYELQMLFEFQVDENQLTSAALKASCNSRSSSCGKRIRALGLGNATANSYGHGILP
ncbi:putative LRR receptor-like serine/threonine-protein kinase [Camellia lanceoleosa]|uniref:LRR receptor-like serine/threonine-protein kinase n=1 Tax=Camellia lanceoleosa TaxID=1840588 RepID=A0ACC0FH72_9ERIC|nr:putative LRR receptor-like serine/threonine-protein kinase [Camellia lanceoleosa]